MKATKVVQAKISLGYDYEDGSDMWFLFFVFKKVIFGICSQGGAKRICKSTGHV